MPAPYLKEPFILISLWSSCQHIILSKVDRSLMDHFHDGYVHHILTRANLNESTALCESRDAKVD